MTVQHIDCEAVIERLFDYLDREIDAETAARIDHHLRHCRDCFSRAEFERRLRRKLSETAIEAAPARLHRRIRDVLGRF